MIYIISLVTVVNSIGLVVLYRVFVQMRQRLKDAATAKKSSVPLSQIEQWRALAATYPVGSPRHTAFMERIAQAEKSGN